MAKEKHSLQEALEELGGDYEVRGYSGRGMHGNECLAITTDRSIGDLDIFQLGVEVGLMYADAQYCGKMKQDSMGLGTVYYWPSVPYFDEDAEEDEEHTDEDGE